MSINSKGTTKNNTSILAVTALLGLSSAAGAAVYMRRQNRKTKKKNESKTKPNHRVVQSSNSGGGGRRKTNNNHTEESKEEDPPTLRSQEEVFQYFAPILQKEGTIHTKNVTSYIRRAIKGEKVTTTIDGKQETQYNVTDDTSWLVCGKAAGEYYVLTDVQLETNYDTKNAKEISQDDKYILAKRLRQQGFLEYQSKRKVYAKRVTQSDMEYFRGHGKDNNTTNAAFGGGAHFIAPWGESVYVEEGDYLVMQYPDDENNLNKEIYRIECHVFHYNYVDDKNLAITTSTTGNTTKGLSFFPVGNKAKTIGVAGGGAVVLIAGIVLNKVL